MPLNLKVHDFVVDKTSGQTTLTKRTPYTRFVSKGEPAISFQNGKFFYDADPKAISKEVVPAWVWAQAKQMDPEYRKRLGLLLPTRLPNDQKVKEEKTAPPEVEQEVE